MEGRKSQNVLKAKEIDRFVREEWGWGIRRGQQWDVLGFFLPGAREETQSQVHVSQALCHGGFALDLWSWG